MAGGRATFAPSAMRGWAAIGENPVRRSGRLPDVAAVPAREAGAMNTTAELLAAERGRILDEAAAGAARAPHYAAAGGVATRERLEHLFDELLLAVDREEISSLLAYAGRIAAERFDGGYDLSEVQVAMNALEEAVWQRIFALCAPGELGEPLRLVSTALGAAKDALARAYVSFATRERPIDLSALFSGTT